MINRAFTWANVHKKALGIFFATCAGAVVVSVYTSNYEDHVERQKEFVLVNEMQDDIREIKNLQQQNNVMVNNVMQTNVETKVKLDQIEKRVDNNTTRLNIMEARIVK